jgi:N,N'-diacetyllegionaminate synthase
MKRTYIIAEAGVNHNGSVEIAERLIGAAREAGADAIKFQTFRSELLVTRHAAKAAYQEAGAAAGESQLEMLRKLELGAAAFERLAARCAGCGIDFLSTAFDLESVQLLRGLGMRQWKIPSGEITNLPYLRLIGSFGCPIIISTGMATLGDVEAAIDALERAGTPRGLMTLLHCTTEYPTPMEDVNLSAMLTLRAAFGTAVGYSDHTLGTHVAVAAAALGAVVVEKHFTISRAMEGPDHKASIEPTELRGLVQTIRDVDRAVGDGFKRPAGAELKNMEVARKSIVAARRIVRGEVFTEENLTTKRPGTGRSPMAWDHVIGAVAQRDYDEDEVLER